MTSDERKGPLGFDLEKTFRITAEISSVALLIGFVASAAIKQLVFASWGMNFVSYAAPSDVVMSGIGFLLDTAFPFILALVTMIGPTVLMKRYQGNRLASMAVLGAMLVVSIWLFSFLSGIALRAQADRLAFGATRFGDAYLLTVVFCALAISLPFIIRNRIGFDPKRHKTLLLSLSVIAVLVCLLSLANIVKLRTDLGYQRSLAELPADVGPACATGQPIVLWIGSVWTVVECSGGKPLALRSDQARKIVPSHAVGTCNPFGMIILWDCRIQHIETGKAAAKPQADG